MQKRYELSVPQTVFGGVGALQNISRVLKDNHVKKVALFTGKRVRAAGLLDTALEQMREAGVEVVILDELPLEPTYKEVQFLVDQCKASGADFIVAIGGGSVLDTAKLASISLTDDYDMEALLEDPKQAKKQVKTLLIPTTAGTGSEATQIGIVAVPEKELKVGIVNAEMIADYVILDAEMIRNLPRTIAASTGVDALAHAIECFTSKKATPLSNLYALQALEIILNDIEWACDDPADMEAKERMQLASFFAGIAIAASGTTAVHALSYPLGGKYHIAHGVSNAILLVPVMRFNEPACRDRLVQVYDRCMRGNAVSAEEKSGAVIRRLAEIVEHLNIPTSLTEFGVPKEDLPGLVTAGMSVTRLLVNNMQDVTPEDAYSIYREVL